MLEFRQNFTLYYIAYRFVTHSTYKYGHRASFAYFHLTAVSQHDYHVSVQIVGQLVLFDKLCSNKAVAGATINQS